MKKKHATSVCPPGSLHPFSMNRWIRWKGLEALCVEDFNRHVLSRMKLLFALLCLAGLPAPVLAAHPLPQKVYDRTITVRLTGNAVVVDYHLEVDALTAYTDLPDLVSRDEMGGITTREAVFKAFLDGKSPEIAN